MYDKASLALIPSGFKSGSVNTLYSVLPANGDGDFDHSRSSTATRVNKDGLIESAGYAPRLDYPLTNGVVGDCPHLLLEPSRTNVLPYSEQFDNSSWGTQAVTVNTNAGISPDGTQTADKIIPSAVSTTHQIHKLSLISSQTCATSVFAKADGINTFTILDGSSAVNGASFNLLDGTFTNNGSGVGSMIYYGNGWYRCIVISITTGFRIYCPTPSTSASGDGSSGVLLWGAQLEAGSYATSYIPTLQNQAETRSADSCNNAGTSAEFNDSEGVLYAEVSTNADSNFKRISIHSGTYVNSVFLDFDNTNNLYGKVIVGGSAVVTIIASGLNIENNNKIALSYKENDFKLFVNGSKVGTDVTGATPTGLNNLAFDLGGGQNFYGKCKQLIYFNEALSDIELETLTS